MLKKITKGPKTRVVRSTLKPVVKQFKSRYLVVRSRHPSVERLKNTVRLPKLAVYRHGSTSESKLFYEINSIDCVRNCSSKLLMKRCFDKGGVKHLPWFPLSEGKIEKEQLTNGKVNLKFPIVVKSHFGSRGKGNHKLDTPEDYRKFVSSGISLSNYIVEPYYSGPVEFRVHITEGGPIYCLRKMLKADVPKEKRWIRNDTTCVWITEFAQNRTNSGQFISFQVKDNEKFDRPGNWNEIIEECKKALRSVGGDILAVDIKAQSSRDSKGKRREKIDFTILEVNSAPSMGDITIEVYKKELPVILERKYANFRKK